MPSATISRIGPRVDGAGARQHLGHGARLPGPRHQRDLRLGGRRRCLDGGDDLVDVGQRDRQSFEDMAALARLAQLEYRAPRDDLAPMPQEGVQHLLQAQQARLAIDQRHHVDAEHLRHLGLGEQVVEQNLRYFAALHFDHDAHAVLVGLVAQAVGCDAVDELVAHQIGDLLDQARLVHLVGQFGDDDGLAVALADILEVSARAHVHAAAAGLVGGDDFLRAVDEARGRKIRARHDLQQLGPASAQDSRSARCRH